MILLIVRRLRTNKIDIKRNVNEKLLFVYFSDKMQQDLRNDVSGRKAELI